MSENGTGSGVYENPMLAIQIMNLIIIIKFMQPYANHTNHELDYNIIKFMLCMSSIGFS